MDDKEGGRTSHKSAAETEQLEDGKTSHKTSENKQPKVTINDFIILFYCKTLNKVEFFLMMVDSISGE